MEKTIIKAIQTHAPIGIIQLVRLLQGSSISTHKSSKHYNKLKDTPSSIIRNFTKQLISLNLIKEQNLPGFPGKVLNITNKGKTTNPPNLVYTPEPTKLTSSMRQTLHLIKQNKSIEEIAKIRKLKERSIYNHIIAGITNNEVNIKDILEENEYKEVKEVVTKHYTEPLKEIKNKLPNTSYDVIRCMRASIRWNKPTLKYPTFLFQNQEMKSKSELIIAYFLKLNNLNFTHEPILFINNKEYRPDFLIQDNIILEHFGRKEKAYTKKMKNKIKMYEQLKDFHFVWTDEEDLNDLQQHLGRKLNKTPLSKPTWK